MQALFIPKWKRSIHGRARKRENTVSMPRTTNLLTTSAALAALLFAAAPLSAATVTWNAATGTWDTATGNWTGGSPIANRYVEGDHAVFSSNSGGTITIQGGGVTPGSTTVSASGGTYVFQSNAVNGGALTKSGNGWLDLTHANSFSSVTINGGIIRALAPNALGNGPVTLNSPGSGGIFVNQNQTIASLSGNSAAIYEIAGGVTTFGTNNADSVFAGRILGGGRAIKVGTGTFTYGSGAAATGSTPSSGLIIAQGAVKLGRTFTSWSNNLVHFDPTAAPGSTGATVDLNGFNLTTGSVGVGNATATADTWVVNTGGGTLRTNRLTIDDNGGTPTLTINGHVDFGTAWGEIDSRDNGTIIINGVISGTNGWRTFGNSKNAHITGSTDNTISGAFSLNGGTFELNKSSRAIAIPGDVNINGGTLRLLQSDQIADTSTVTFGSFGIWDLNDQNETVAAVINANTVSSNSTLTLAGTASTVLQVTSAQNANKLLDVNLALTGASGGNVVLTSTGTGNNAIRLGGATAGSRSLDLGTVTRTFTVAENSNIGVEASVTSTISGSGGLTKAGAGTLQLDAANTYRGDTTVSGGTLKLNHNLALQNSAFNTSGGGTLDLTSVNAPTLGGLKGGGNLALSGNVTSLTLDVANGATANYSGNLSGANASLTKTGRGLQVLGGTNTYAGPTTINEGILRLTGSIASGTTTVNAGGTLEAIAGSLGGSLDVTSGGRVMAWNIANPLTVSGDTLFQSGGIYAASTGGVTITDGLQLDSGWVLELGQVRIVEGAGPIVLFEFTTDNGIDLNPVWDWEILAGDSSLANLSIISGSGGLQQLVLNNVMLVPEPASVLSLAGAGLALLALTRRRRSATAR